MTSTTESLLNAALKNQGFKTVEDLAAASRAQMHHEIEVMLSNKAIAPDGLIETSKIFKALPASVQEAIKSAKHEATKVAIAINDCTDDDLQRVLLVAERLA